MNKKRTQYYEDEKNNEEKKTMQRGGVIELNILKQTSISLTNIFLSKTVFNWSKDNWCVVYLSEQLK